MTLESFRNVSRRLVIELAAVVALVSYHVGFPRGESSGAAWGFVFANPRIWLHVLIGSLILVEAVVFLIRSIRSHHRVWMIWTAIGLAFALLAYAGGVSYVAAQAENALTFMSLGWFGAIVTYGIGWYWGRKQVDKQDRQRRGTE